MFLKWEDVYSSPGFEWPKTLKHARYATGDRGRSMLAASVKKSHCSNFLFRDKARKKKNGWMDRWTDGRLPSNLRNHPWPV